MIDVKKYYYFFISLSFLIAIWLVKFIEIISGAGFVKFGVYPRKFEGAAGILFAPFIHSGFDHLLSNSFPLFIFMLSLFYFYKTSAKNIFLLIFFASNILLWIFGRSSYHIGASGIIYGLAAFFFFSGVIRKNKRDITISLLVTFLYGSLVWGVLPIKEGVSWEGHLLGAFSGIAAAFLFKNKDLPPKYDWEDEETDGRNLEIKYDD